MTGYQGALQLLRSLKDPGQKIVISVSENSQDYKRYYYEIERWLKDSCKTLNYAISKNDDVTSEFSLSGNKEARAQYNKGLKEMEAGNYADAITFFEKSVSIDPKFAFAWDNIGICNRRLGNYQKAEAAYKRSIEIDPKGRTALQNLALIYAYQGKPDLAISAYADILKHYPGDAEVYYGIAIVYFEQKKDMNQALDNVCKAYNIYVREKSAYRSDAEKVINMIYQQMKKDNREEEFWKILKDNNIKSS